MKSGAIQSFRARSNDIRMTSAESSKRRRSWVKSISVSTATSPDSWPPRNGSIDFDWSKSTYQVYSTDTMKFAPDFSAARRRLDYGYHTNPMEYRQLLQDTILSKIIRGRDDESADMKTNQRQRPWIVFTAGAMGVGKGYVMTQLQNAKLFPASNFVKIDPDMLKSELPEQAGYLKANRESAATKLHRESTQMADVLLEHALSNHFSILVDGSLRDVDYYSSLFRRIHSEFSAYRIAILHVTASRDEILKRAEHRAEKTGRVVPHELLEASMKQVPESVARLSSLADAVHVIANNEDQPLELVYSKLNDGDDTANFSWDQFSSLWKEDHADGSHDGMPQSDLKEPHALKIPICKMLSVFSCSKSHEVANNIWSASYPNFCARCALTCDGQCGICIHGVHMCSCSTCNATDSLQT